MNKDALFIAIIAVMIGVGVVNWCLEGSSYSQSTILTTAGIQDSPFGVHPAGVAEGNTRDYTAAMDIGVQWTRGVSPTYFLWVLAQPDVTVREYDWGAWDADFASVPEGMQVMMNIVPAMNTMIAEDMILDPGTSRERHISDYMESKSSWLPKAELRDEYQAFVRACVERYDGDGVDDTPGLATPVSAWQIGNEPPKNLTMSSFVSLVELTLPVIRDADPNAFIVCAGPSDPRDGDHIARFSELVPVFDILQPGDMQAFDFHWFGYARSGYYSKDFIDLIRQELDRRGFNDMRIWITETGTYSGSPLDFQGTGRLQEQSEAEQAEELLKRYVFPLSHGVDKVFWAWGMMEGFKQEDTFHDHTGLIYDGKQSGDLGRGVKKLSYYTYKLMTEKLEGSAWNNVLVINDGTDNVYIYEFPKIGGGESVYVAWWDYFNESSSSKTVILKVGDKRSVTITQAIPDAEWGIALNESDYPYFFRSETQLVRRGKVRVTLQESPVFIE